jgi:hypothetical protein
VRPGRGETVRSYLSRLAAANHLDPLTLAALLSPWYIQKINAHDERGRSDRQPPAFALQSLATAAALPTATLARALPAFRLEHNDPRRPVRATTACRRCTIARGIGQAVPVLRPHHERLCTRHRIWTSPHGQIDLGACPEIIAAQRKVNKLLRRHTPAPVIFAEVTARQLIAEHRDRSTLDNWHRRTRELSRHNPGSSTDALNEAIVYPETIAAAAALLSVA